MNKASTASCQLVKATQGPGGTSGGVDRCATSDRCAAVPQHPRGTTHPRLLLPSPRKVMVLLVELHAEPRTPDGEEKPQCWFVYLAHTSALPLSTFPSCPQPPPAPGEGGAGGPSSALAAGLGTAALGQQHCWQSTATPAHTEGSSRAAAL